MIEKLFHLECDYEPAGDQPQAIRELVEGIEAGLARQTLLGVTGSGKSIGRDEPLYIERYENGRLVSQIVPAGAFIDGLLDAHGLGAQDGETEQLACADGTYFTHAYDPATDTWARLPNMPTARDHFHAAVLDGQFWAIGGRDAAIDATVTVNESFDFSSGKWMTGHAPLPTARGGFAVAALGDELLVIGGEGGGKVSNAVEAYAPGTDSWRTLAPMPTARHGIQAVTCNGSVYIAAGGTKQGRGPTAVHEVFSFGPRQPCPAP